MRISKSNWHKIGCDEECGRAYCQKHRKIFNWCQTSEAYQGKLHDGGECPVCMAEYRMATDLRLWNAHEVARGRAA